MTNVITLIQIEKVINYWRDIEGTESGLGGHARAVADVYGEMIYTRVNSVELHDLNEFVQSAIINALMLDKRCK